jgi:hypothetical protein
MLPGIAGIAGLLASAAPGATDPHFASTVVLLSFDGANGSTTFTDGSFAARGNANATGDSQVVTAFKKFGTGSARLDGNLDSIAFTDHADFTLSGDFTLEGWFSFDTTVLGSIQTLVAHYNTTSNQRGYWWRYRGDLATDALEFIGSADGSTTATVTTGNWTPVADTFYFLVLERSGTTFRQYVDGVMLSKATNAISLFDASGQFIIGQTGNLANTLRGNVDEFRLTLGVARYDSDAGHAVPTGPFPRS